MTPSQTKRYQKYRCFFFRVNEDGFDQKHFVFSEWEDMKKEGWVSNPLEIAIAHHEEHTNTSLDTKMLYRNFTKAEDEYEDALEENTDQDKIAELLAVKNLAELTLKESEAELNKLKTDIHTNKEIMDISLNYSVLPKARLLDFGNSVLGLELVPANGLPLIRKRFKSHLQKAGIWIAPHQKKKAA